MNRLIERGVRYAASILPSGMHIPIMQGISAAQGGENRVLAQLAKSANLSGFLADGSLGIIQASSADETIIPAYARDGVWSAHTVAFIKKALANGGTYLDIGANIGLTTIPIAQDERVRCFSFEPGPTNFFHLTENVARNCLKDNVTLVCAAVTDKPGKIQLGLNDSGNPGDHRIIKGTSGRNAVEVDAITLDEFQIEIRGALAVKVDVQGAEPFVIMGGANLLRKADAIVLEYWPCGMADMGANPRIVFDLVSQFSKIEVVEMRTGESAYFSDSKAAIDVLAAHFNHARRDDPDKQWDIYLSR